MREEPGKPVRDRLAFHLFWLSAAFLAMSYGVVAGMRQLFPYRIFARAIEGGEALRNGGEEDTWYYKKVSKPFPPIVNSGRAQPGLNLVTEILSDELSVKVMDLDGKTLNRWSIDWFRIWPNAQHVPDRIMPRSRPGTHVNGAALLDNGDLVFNFEHLGMVRMSRDGEVQWRLAYQTHHSVHRGDDGNLWVCGQREHDVPDARFPSLVPPFVEDTVVVVTPKGQIVREWSVPELLSKNGRQGLLCLANLDVYSTAVTGDVTHLNHVEPFPARMAPGIFGPGDVLVSLRNINTVFVFETRTDRIKFVSTGQFVRQHDPHFVDANTISVFDNNCVGAPGTPRQSRIVLVSARDQALKVWFAGTPEHPFFTPIMGRHQWLADGHLLITDSCGGRAFELDQKGEVVWWYVNFVEADVIGAVEQVERIPLGFASLFGPR
ncbi:MAG: aryl-sulfate sulfotransferase [Planctomycetes bacterium]|nr:aryl-sulfate sulfotransferase [Planctomycetota bacterium]